MSKPETIMIDEVKYIREDGIKAAPVDKSNKDHPYTLGALYCIRTVTMIQTGKLIAVYDGELVLDDAAWIADTGRFSEFLEGNGVGEVEPFANNVIVNRGSIIDVTVMPKLFLEMK